MDPKLAALAGRLRQALDTAEKSNGTARTRAAEELASARAARSKLLDDLVVFAEAIGHISAERGDDHTALQWRGRTLSFIARGPADHVEVSFDGLLALAASDDAPGASMSPIRLYRARSEGNPWMVGVMNDGVEEVEPLFDIGLTHLLVAGLGLPLERPASGPQPGLDDLVSGD